MRPGEVLVRALSTEASEAMLERQHTVTFQVALAADKVDVRRAIEARFGVRPLSVRTAVDPGKLRRRGSRVSRRPKWKKARVVLADAASAARVAEAPK